MKIIESTSQLLPHEAALELVCQLHAALDIRQIMQTFAKGIRRYLSCDAIQYVNPEGRLEVTIGKTAKHKFNYFLTNGLDRLGEIIFSRHVHFNEAELKWMEELMCLLLNPMKNALLYKKAVDSALHDPLTGLSNRARLESSIQQEIEFSRRYDSPFSLLMMDIDYFKKINDNYGHLAGDQYLKQFSKLLTQTCRLSDLLFRVGGEEFLVLLRKTNASGAQKTASRIRKRVSDLTVVHQEQIIQTTISIGCVTYSEGDTHHRLLERVDNAVYRAKHEGRNRVCI